MYRCRKSFKPNHHANGYIWKKIMSYVRSGLSADVRYYSNAQYGPPHPFPYLQTMLFWMNNRWTRLPIIGENQGLFIHRWGTIPEYLTRFLTAITAGVSHHFSGLSAQCNPEPNFGVLRKIKDQISSASSTGVFWGSTGFRVVLRGEGCFAFFLTRHSRFGDKPQRCVRFRAYWSVPDKL